MLVLIKHVVSWQLKAFDRLRVGATWNKRQHLEGRRFHKNEDVKMAAGEWLLMQKPNFYHKRIFKDIQRWDKCINVFGDYAEK
jgi:hypothetical protein